MATSESNGDATGTTSGDTIEELTKEVENLKKKLEEERAKFNDVECNSFIHKNLFIQTQFNYKLFFFSACRCSKTRSYYKFSIKS